MHYAFISGGTTNRKILAENGSTQAKASGSLTLTRKLHFSESFLSNPNYRKLYLGYEYFTAVLLAMY